MKTRSRLIWRHCFFLLTISTLLLAQRAWAIDLLVYNTGNGGAGSLRQAISDNNVIGGGNRIIFANGLSGTITLTSGELTITTNVTILGPGPDVLAVSGNNASLIFRVTNAVANISGLSIVNGYFVGGSGPGGVWNYGTLTLSNCVVRYCVGMQGGGIVNSGVLAIYNSTIHNNSSANYAGGIANLGSLTLMGSSVVSNAYTGGFSLVYAGGIYGGGAMTNCTIAANSGGLAALNSGVLTMRNTTVVNNSSAYGVNGGGSVGSCIIAGNGSSGDVSGVFTSAGYNLVGRTNNSTGWGAVGDQLGTTASPLNPLLGPLQNNGGPTPTMAPLPNSPAIDQGKSFGAASDQRGRSRPYDYPGIPSATLGDGSDIGAFEVSPITLIVSNNNNSGSGSLRQTILDAFPSDSITFASNVVGTVALTNGELVVGKPVAIVGPANSRLVISGNNASRVFHLTGGTVSIANLTIANGNAVSSDGGGLLGDAGSTLLLNNCTLSGNTAGSGGGNVGGGLANSGVLLATNCTISGNYAPSGGGLYNFATAILQNCTITSNSATSGGGYDHALVNSSNSVGSTIIAGNSASGSGPDLFYGYTSRGYNLIGKIDAGTGFTNGVNHDQVGSIATPLNPLLGPLQDNGGPTFTHALSSTNSPAMDKGLSNGLPTDQRGAPRPFDFDSVGNASGGDGSDIGAFESGGPQLNIQELGTSAVLSWPAYYGGFTLQSVTNLSLANSWTTVGGAPTASGNQYVFTNGPTTGNQFYRLKGN